MDLQETTKQPSQPDFIGLGLILFFFLLLGYGGFLSYKSIDFDVLKKLEAAPLVMPTPIPTQAVVPTPPANH